MPRTRSPYPREFRRQMVELVRAGHHVSWQGSSNHATKRYVLGYVKQTGMKAGAIPD